MAVDKLISIYLVLVAIAVAVQFVVFPLYAYGVDGEVMASALDVWHVLDWFMAVGLVLVVVTTYGEKRRRDGDESPDLRPWLRSRFMFYGTVLLALAFVPNWFAAVWGSNDNSTIWHLINTVLPVVFVAEAHRLWRATPA